MCCEDLACARCGSPVVEARCPACRASKAAMHDHTGFTLSPQLMIVIAVLLTMVAVVAARY